jgi:hypothetical protein
VSSGVPGSTPGRLSHQNGRGQTHNLVGVKGMLVPGQGTTPLLAQRFVPWFYYKREGQMSFNFTAAGTRNEVVDQLDGLHDSQLGNDNFGAQIRDAIVDGISVGATLEPPADQRYEVTCSGHSGRDAILTFQGTVKVVQVPPVAPDAQVVAEEVLAP